MELLSPAGNAEKLRYAYLYGADAAYVGIEGFSLRAQADNFSLGDPALLRRLKGGRKLYGAFNIFFRDDDIDRLEAALDAVAACPFDALIVSDIGVAPLLRRRLPGVELHLSTQANCLNARSAALYRDLGFSRVIPGRELSLREIEGIKRAVPDLAIEVFAHGAMCLALSGRCYLSAWMNGRDANRGDCSHSCRWKYRLRAVGEPGLALEEEQRPGELFPVYEDMGYTSVMSSKDLNLIDHLRRLGDAGVDSIKIEGRMKSTYYVALVTRAYRRELDRLAGAGGDSRPWIDELYKVSHREFSTGFLFGRDDIARPTDRSYEASHLFVGTVEQRLSPDPAFAALLPPAEAGRPWRRWRIELKNPLRSGDQLELTGPELLAEPLVDFRLANACGAPCAMAVPGRYHELYSRQELQSGWIIRKSLSAPGPAS